MPQTRSPARRCRGPVKRYGQIVARAGHDLALRRGECSGPRGPNGAGSTTTVAMLEGLDLRRDRR